MLYLILGLVLFFSVHSVRIIADDWRTKFIETKGKLAWRGIYSVFSVLSLVLIVYGFGESRANPVLIWNPPLWTRHGASLLVFIAFILLAAGHIPRNHIRQKLGHPLFAGIKVWAFAHLIANGRLGDILLFSCFMIWSIIGFAAARKRDRTAGVVYQKGTFVGTIKVSLAGTVMYAVFALYLHRLLIGVPPF